MKPKPKYPKRQDVSRPIVEYRRRPVLAPLPEQVQQNASLTAAVGELAEKRA